VFLRVLNQIDLVVAVMVVVALETEPSKSPKQAQMDQRRLGVLWLRHRVLPPLGEWVVFATPPKDEQGGYRMVNFLFCVHVRAAGEDAPAK
jgi:hypothetical protein